MSWEVVFVTWREHGTYKYIYIWNMWRAWNKCVCNMHQFFRLFDKTKVTV